jgi:hypothetical protein
MRGMPMIAPMIVAVNPRPMIIKITPPTMLPVFAMQASSVEWSDDHALPG